MGMDSSSDLRRATTQPQAPSWRETSESAPKTYPLHSVQWAEAGYLGDVQPGDASW